MNSLQTNPYLQTLSRRKRTVGLVISLVGIFLLDLTLAEQLPFWVTPLLLGLFTGILIGSGVGGAIAGLGTMIGRLLSTVVLILTQPGVLETADLFLAAIGDFLGVSLPAGALIVIALSTIICGLFGLLGGFIGSSGTQLIQTLTEKEE